ncbi:methyl-accepting chemotaxis protein [Spirochaeta lutea]|uniref:methyl-accepting chemotaxis protein n=1 Tax=Spirochaeta lutea TaxID=1480694 RepID=UPI00068A0429|nr:methyl-accepting chemotaxis protein [Spirochaeta lutea]
MKKKLSARVWAIGSIILGQVFWIIEIFAASGSVLVDVLLITGALGFTGLGIGLLIMNANTVRRQLAQALEVSQEQQEAVRAVEELIRNNDSQSQDLISSIRASLFMNQRIQTSVDEIDDQAETMAQQVRSTSAAVEQTQATLESFTKRIESQSAAVVQTSSSIEEMNANLDSVSRVANQYRGQTGELVDLAGKGEEQAEHTNQIIEQINTHVDAVQSVIQVINGVASQTNLLSMNAAIEAAHAGDAGRGFAVVAEEIRKLAESTAENARNIGGTLKQIVQEIGEAKDLGNENLAYFKRVREDVNGVANAFAEIDQATDEISVGSGEVVKATSDLVHITEEIQQGAREIAESVTEMSRGLKELLQASDATDENSEKIDQVLSQNNKVLATLAQASIEGVDSINELEKVVLNLDESAMNSNMAALRHLFWAIQIRRLIDGDTKGAKLRSTALTDCWTHAWTQSQAGRSFQGFKAYDEFVPLHREFHATITQLVNRIKGSSPESRSEEEEDKLEENYQALLVLISRIISILNELGDEVDRREAERQARSGEADAASTSKELEESLETA